MDERDHIEAAIKALENQRHILGDVIVDTALAPLLEKLETLTTNLIQDQQRKQITILFADLSNYTSLSETMDAEDIFTLMNSVWSRLDRIIYDYGGMIDKHIGDGVMALWGAPNARENDVEQAIRAGLAMQAELASLCAEQGVSLAMRVGINTGAVLLGAIGRTGEYTAMGDAVNLASRLEHSAPLHSTIISHDTYRHVRGLFDVRPLEPLKVKGKEDPIQTYVVLRAKPRQFYFGTRKIENVETQMIGREREVRQLKQHLHHVLNQHQLQAITIIGEAGLGKSRLFYEFRKWVELHPEVLHFFLGRATQKTSRLAYALLRHILFFRFDILDSDPATVAREKLTQGVSNYFGPEQPDATIQAAFIGQLIGLDFSTTPAIKPILEDSKQIRDRALMYLSQMFTMIAKTQPILLVVEDLHWADNASLDALHLLAHQCSDLPLFMICLARSEFLQYRPDWQPGGVLHTWMKLEALNKKESRQLVHEILQKVPTVPEALRELVISSSEGNPFYIEELVKMLIDEGVIICGPAEWHIIPERLDTVQVPPTLTGVIQARLDALPPAEYEILQHAAILGRTFWAAAVTMIGKHNSSIVDNLAAIQQRDLIFRRETSRFQGTYEYVFKHALLREVVYEGILKRDRKYYHLQAAVWLIEAAGERIDEYAHVIAEHYQEADKPEEAGIWYLHAGEQAHLSYDLSTSQHLYQKALELLPTQAKGLVYVRLGRVLELAGDWDTAEQYYLQALQATPQDQQVTLADAEYKLGHLALLRGSNEDALSWLRKANHHVSPTTDQAVLADVLRGLGVVYERLGGMETASAYLEQSLKLAQKLDDQRRVTQTLIELGKIRLTQGLYTEAQQLLESSLGEASAMEDVELIINAIQCLGILNFEKGANQYAQILLEEALMIAKNVGNPYGVLISQINLGHVYAALNMYERALKAYRSTLHGCYQIGDRTSVTSALISIAALLVAHDSSTTTAHLSSKIQGTLLNLPDPALYIFNNREQVLFDQASLAAKQILGPQMYQEYLQVGYLLSLPQIIEEIQVFYNTFFKDVS